VRLLQKLLRKQTVAPGIVAISFVGNGFTIAVTRYAEQNRPRLLHCEFVAANAQQLAPQLEILVKAYRLEEYDCHILLAPDQYRTMSIETPAVNTEEIKQAVAWRIAELLDYPIEQAAIDFYALPKSNRANATPMLEVFAVNRELSAALIQSCKQVGLNIKVIDIQETALRNIATLMRENAQGIALLHLQKDCGRLIIQKRGSLYLSRKIVTGYLDLNENSSLSAVNSQDNEQDSLLALEIQRSFDYVENYFDIPPITSLATVLMPINTQAIINFLNFNHGITARAMDLSATVEGDILLDDATQNLCAPVIGASLRRWLETVST